MSWTSALCQNTSRPRREEAEGVSERDAIRPIEETIADERQRWARHYGVHPYFTRRSASVVRTYLDRYSRPGDVVLDPFGGSGVTAIEAFLMGRTGIQNDINPFANFLASAVADTRLGSLEPLERGFERVAALCRDRLHALESASETELKRALKLLPLPPNVALHRTSDADRFHDLFTPRQMAALATLKQAIDGEPDEAVRVPLLLAWSATAAKLNRTFISAKGRAESRGGASIFSIYRYKLAKTPVELPLWSTFHGRFSNVIAAKKEVLALRDQARRRDHEANVLDSRRGFRCLAVDAADIAADIGGESVDYVFTDPPYGAFIAYLDLSTLWNHWLGFQVSRSRRRAEIIVGGEQAISEDRYKARLAASMVACVDVLRPDRWLSIVFQHWDVSYFETILRAVSGAGAELRAAVTQEREVIWSMHKKKNAETMLSGEMILSFYKPARAATAVAAAESRGLYFAELLDDILRVEATDAFTSQWLFNRLILCAWKAQSLSQLAVKRDVFVEELRRRGWFYDPRRHVWRRGAAVAEELPLGLEDRDVTAGT
jgi:16S rRNA G966 N2-methylase RsmD